MTSVPSLHSSNTLFTNSHLDNGSKTRYVDSEFFVVDCYRLTGENTILNDKPFQMVSILEGEGIMDGQAVKKGDHFIVCSDQKEIVYDGVMTIMITTL